MFRNREGFRGFDLNMNSNKSDIFEVNLQEGDSEIMEESEKVEQNTGNESNIDKEIDADNGGENHVENYGNGMADNSGKTNIERDGGVSENLNANSGFLEMLLEKIKTEIQNSAGSLQSEISSLKGEIEINTGNIRKEVGSIRSEIEASSNRLDLNISEVRSSITDIRNQVETSINNLQTEWNLQMDARIQSVQTEVNNRISELDSKLSGLDNQVVGISSQISDRDTQISEVNNRVTELQTEMSSRINTVTDTLNSHMESVNTHVSSLNSHMDEVNTQVSNLQLITESVEREARGRFRDLEKEVNKLTEKNIELERIICQNNCADRSASVPMTSVSSENQPSTSQGVTSQAGCSRENMSNETVAEVMNIPPVSCTNVPEESSTRQQNSIIQDLAVPRFGNKSHENPVMFLNSLEAFFQLKSVPEKCKMLVVKNALVGACAAWLDLTVPLESTYNEFRRKFLNYYWDGPHQNSVRSKLNFGRYDPKNGLKMADYFLELGQLSKLLDPPLLPREFIDIAAQHFPPEVRNVLIVARPQSFEDTTLLLKQLQSRTGIERGFGSSNYEGNRKGMKQEINVLNSENGAHAHNYRNTRQESPRNNNSVPYEGQSYRNGENFNRNQQERGSNQGQRFRGNQNSYNQDHDTNRQYRGGQGNPRINCVNFTNQRFNRNKPRWNERNGSQGFSRNRNYNYNNNWRNSGRRENRPGPERFNEGREGFRYPPGIDRERVEEVINRQNARSPSPDRRSNPENNNELGNAHEV